MKLPKLPTRTPKGSPAGTSGFKPPALVSDVLKDMRDRRLVVPAIALLVAIVAVPILLSSSPDPAVPAAPLAPDPEAAAVEPGVFAVQEIGVRDYRERLNALDRNNPFGDRFEPDDPAGSAEGAQLAPADMGEPVATPKPSGVTEPAPSSSGDVTGETGTTPPAPVVDEERYVLVPRVDVEVGIVDRDRRRTIEGVKAGDLLPEKKTPVAMFLGNRDDSSLATFLVSRDVSAVNGDGSCKPGKNNCEFLRLKDGDSAYLRFADGHRYVISLKRIYFERVPEGKADDS